jgi:pyroglutamyl-peptidase
MMLTVLATGFSAFPGARHNPSAALMVALERRRAWFAGFGIRLETRILPVLYAEIAPRLAKLAADVRPDAILHFGLAGRRRDISIETRASNRVSLLAPDAGGACTANFSLVRNGAAAVQARVPAAQILAALRGAGIKGCLSRDAGTYLCNAALYHSAAARQPPSVGFIHIPWPARRGGHPTFAEIVKGAEIAILAIAVAARREKSAA